MSDADFHLAETQVKIQVTLGGGGGGWRTNSPGDLYGFHKGVSLDPPSGFYRIPASTAPAGKLSGMP